MNNENTGRVKMLRYSANPTKNGHPVQGFLVKFLFLFLFGENNFI